MFNTHIFSPYLLKDFNILNRVAGEVSGELSDSLSHLRSCLTFYSSHLDKEISTQLVRLLAVKLNKLYFNDLIASDNSFFSGTLRYSQFLTSL